MYYLGKGKGGREVIIAKAVNARKSIAIRLERHDRSKKNSIK